MTDFRVIVLGAGPAGLFTAHALAAAGIDFVVLERQAKIVRFRGALLVLFPPLVRLLDQLGLYKPTLAYTTRLTTKASFTHDGEPLCNGPVFEAIEEELGYPSIALSRGNWLRILYENLPGRATKVRPNAHAVKIETQTDGVRVHLADGSVVEGSVVIAADGVHSPARALIQRLEKHGSAAPSPMVPTYLSLFGVTRGVRADVTLGDFAESHGPGTVSQSMRLPDAMYFTVLKRLDGPPPGDQRFTSEEADKFAREMADLTIFPGVKLREVWPRREEASTVLLHQEEGLADKWHHGRVVLVGDAAHKTTSVTGQGAFLGALSAVALVNCLRATLRRSPRPSTADLEAAFAAYQASRVAHATAVVALGGEMTRFTTWAGEDDEALDRKESDSKTLAEETVKRFVPAFSQCPILDFIPFHSQRGKTPWAVDCEPSARPRL
ncbi:hypothetical protein F4802DRAFT_471584 [Xylaria palmicola]|nr:hypothetical protein F4802DRAFT_471584 [Xylaria palmicola]